MWCYFFQLANARLDGDDNESKRRRNALTNAFTSLAPKVATGNKTIRYRLSSEYAGMRLPYLPRLWQFFSSQVKSGSMRCSFAWIAGEYLICVGVRANDTFKWCLCIYIYIKIPIYFWCLLCEERRHSSRTIWGWSRHPHGICWDDIPVDGKKPRGGGEGIGPASIAPHHVQVDVGRFLGGYRRNQASDTATCAPR